MATIAQVTAGVPNVFEKMKFGSSQHDEVAVGWPGTSNTVAVGGIDRAGQPFAAWDQGIPNGTGMRARWGCDGIDASRFILCAIGEFLDSEGVEHNYPILPVFRALYWSDAAGFGTFRGGRSMNAMCRIHGVPEVTAASIGGCWDRPNAPGLFGGYPNRPVGVAFVQEHNVDELIAEGRAPTSVYEATALARKEERVRRMARGVPYGRWLSGWLERRPPDSVRGMYGEWPHRLTAPLTDWEPRERLLDPEVSKARDVPMAEVSRY